MSAPLISVLIVNYNSGSRLDRVFGALAAQTFERFEVIVLDNASTDGSGAPRPGPDGLDINWLTSPVNTGFASGVMEARAAARGEWLAMLNPDAYPATGWLAALRRAGQTYGPEAALGSVQLMTDPPDRLDGLGDAYHISGTAWRGGFGRIAAPLLPREDVEIFAPCFAAAMVHRTAFDRTGGLDRDFFCYHEDVDWGFRHRLAGGASILVHDAEVHHEGSAITGRYSDFSVYHGIRNRIWTFAKNMPVTLLPLALPAFLLFALVFLVRSFMLGIGGPYMRGMRDGVRGVPAIWRKRQANASHRRAGVMDIARALSWSPIAPLRRAPHHRSLGEEARPRIVRRQETPRRSTGSRTP